LSDPKKPGDGKLDDLKSKLGLAQPGGSGLPGMGFPVPPPPGGIAPPPFGPGGSAPVGPPMFGGGSPVPPVVGSAPPFVGLPGGKTPSAVPPPPGLGGVVPPPPLGGPAGSPPLVAPPALSPPAVAPPSFAPMAGMVPPPTFGAAANVAAPPFAQQAEEEPEEEIIREERVVKIEADESVDEREAGKRNLAPHFVTVGAVVLMALFGFLGGGQIDRAVRANAAITAAVVIHNAVVNDQEVVRNLKSRVSGAARKALEVDNPSADYQLIEHLAKVRDQRPFGASVWAGEFYQAFRSRQLVFEYYRAMHALWDEVDEFSRAYEDPALARVIKAWPERRREILAINDEKGASGFGVGFRSEAGNVLGVLGVFRNSRREQQGAKVWYQSDFTPFGATEAKTLVEYVPTYGEISKEPETYFVRINPDNVIGKNRDVVGPGGPLIQESQGPYREYLAKLNSLSKSLQGVQAQQDNLIQALSDIRQARRPFTFGF
jgi:hypothetical protein